MMALPAQRWRIRAALGLTAMCLAGYLFGPPLYWHLIEEFSAAAAVSCPSCDCDCDSHPLLSIPRGLSNASLTGCAKHDPEVGEDTEKNIAELLSEELKLREDEGVENQRRAETALLEAKKLTSQYMKEAEKCNSGMETCEGARVKAEAALVAQKRLSATWETRAREMGWRDGTTSGGTRSQSHQAYVQTM
ncbi:unnamed protein product [Cuscuta campestris]|uniref:DUF1068 domain-containing protein n=2 Tax=Cuscuta sect. Cleistogrammica TaxID=1824901 RepID=A0A484MM18_9ASTE|nr:hypothetical protein DM860_002905 [Cuscuta australis]VFQ89084.1 unnamed protein product [Cuscuta campestris]